MNNRFDLDVKNIQIIVKKTEEESFRFVCNKRDFDGFILLLSGEGIIIDKAGVIHKIATGDTIIPNAMDDYVIELSKGSTYITSGFTVVTDKSLLPFIYKCRDTEIKELCRLCDIWQSRSQYSYAECRIGIMRFYMNVIISTNISPATDNDVSRAVDYIHQNFKTNFSGKDIAQYCSVSLSHLRSKFQKQMGQSIISYREALRIAAAKEMLESRYFSVTTIADELGYCDVYHFSKAFAAKTGISPTKWLKRQ